MYRHEEIINKLTIKQKLSILADATGYTDGAVIEAGVPPVKVASLVDTDLAKGKIFPSYESLANSWDMKLIESVCKSACNGQDKSDANILITPKANVINTVYEKGLSEDPLLSGKIVASCVKAVNDVGAMPCVPSLTLSKTTVEYSDNELNLSALSNYYVRPFEVVANSSDRFAIQIAEDDGEGSYANVNSKMVEQLESNTQRRFFQIIASSSGEKAISNAKSSAVLSIKGSYGALQSAYDNYIKLKSDVESGLMDESELEHAINSGTAISEESVNEAVDKALDFAFACGKRIPQVQSANDQYAGYGMAYGEQTAQANDVESLSYDAVVKSSVLLKNAQHILPIKKAKVAVVGHMAKYGESLGRKTVFTALSENANLSVVGYEQGYDLSVDRSDELISKASHLVRSADFALVFLGTDSRANSQIKNLQSAKLPASQLALIDSISRQGKPIIAVVSSSYAVDLKFEAKCAGLLLAPIDALKSADAIADMISGRISPSGKLACTRYVDTDERFARLKNDKRLGKIKVGQMVGYRGYKTNGEAIKYPFGFGLSYTTFTYSNAYSSGSKMSVTVKNTGSYDGEEIVQVYAGVRGSVMVRPARVLVGFIKVALKRGESKTISIKADGGYTSANSLIVGVEKYNFETYDFTTGKSETEGCNYDLYVGSNINEVRKVGDFYKNGKRLNNGGEKTSDYVTTATNVVADGYTLEKTTPKAVQKSSKIGAHVATIISLIADLFILVMAMLSATSGLDFITFNPSKSGFGLTVALTVIINTVLIIALIKKAKMPPEIDHVSIPEKPIVMSKEVEASYDSLFFSEFSDNVVEEEEEEVFDDFTAYFDSSIDMPSLCNRLIDYSGAFGLKISLKTAISAVSAFSASRLVVIKSSDQAKADLFTQILSKFFESPYYLYNVNNDYCTTDSLLYEKTSADGYAETAVLQAINDATEDSHKIKLAIIKGIKASSTSTYLSKCLRYVHNPLKSYKISVDKQISGAVCSIPANVWFILCLDEGEFIADLPANVADAAAFIDLNGESSVPEKTNLSLRPVSYHQFVDMTDLCRGRNQLGEDFWKKVDKFSEYVQTYNQSFAISNRAWLQIEKFAGVSLACDTLEEDVLDMVLTAKIVPAALPVIKASDVKADVSIAHSLEDCFGDKSVKKAVELVKDSGVNVKNQ